MSLTSLFFLLPHRLPRAHSQCSAVPPCLNQRENSSPPVAPAPTPRCGLTSPPSLISWPHCCHSLLAHSSDAEESPALIRCPGRSLRLECCSPDTSLARFLTFLRSLLKCYLTPTFKGQPPSPQALSVPLLALFSHMALNTTQ